MKYNKIFSGCFPSHCAICSLHHIYHCTGSWIRAQQIFRHLFVLNLVHSNCSGLASCDAFKKTPLYQKKTTTNVLEYWITLQAVVMLSYIKATLDKQMTGNTVYSMMKTSDALPKISISLPKESVSAKSSPISRKGSTFLQKRSTTLSLPNWIYQNLFVNLSAQDLNWRSNFDKQLCIAWYTISIFKVQLSVVVFVDQ